MNVLYNIIKDIKDSQRNEHNRTKLNLTGFKGPTVRGQTVEDMALIYCLSLSKLSKRQSNQVVEKKKKWSYS